MAPETSSSLSRVLAIIGALIFLGVWVVAHLVWASMSLMGGLMANDAGRVPEGQHAALLGGLIGGQLATGAAGLAATLAFVWRGARQWLLLAFALLLVGGAAWQVMAFRSFATAAAQSQP